MYTLYSHIIKNDTGDIHALVSDKIHVELNFIGGAYITSYIPIPPTDILNFMMKITNEVKDAFEVSETLKTEKSYINISRKKSRVYTSLDFQPEFNTTENTVGELMLELPILSWDVMFNIIEEIRDFFQENLY